MRRFDSIGVIKNELDFNDDELDYFLEKISMLRQNGKWRKEDLLNLFNTILPDFNHKETGKYLDQRM